MNYTTLISVEELNENLEHPDWVIVDCRFTLSDTEKGANVYEVGHLPGAYYAHLDDDLSGEIIPGETSRHPLPSIENLSQLFSSWGIEEGKQVIVYDDLSGFIASRLWWLLNWLGHEKVAVLDGGWPAWVARAYPITTEIPSKQTANFMANVRADLLVDVQEVFQKRLDPNYLLIDSRDAVRYSGEKEPIDPIAGHIPGASNLPFKENIGADKKMKGRAVLRERFEKISSGKTATDIVFYCGSGVTACHNLLAMKHAGLGEGKLYAGSWSEWITHKDRPIGTGNPD